MKSTIKKPVAVLLALVLMLTSVMLSSVTAFAATDDTLTVNVTSNIFPAQTMTITDFAPYEDELGDAYVTVEYNLLGADKLLVNFQGVLTWDPTVLEFKEAYNQTTFGSRELLNVFPFAVSQGLGTGTVNTFDDANTGRIAGNYSSVAPAAFADEEDGSAITVVKAVFRVLDRNAEVTVNCNVNTLALCDEAYADNPYTQSFLVNNNVVNENGAQLATCSTAITDEYTEEEEEEDILDPNLTPVGFKLTLLAGLKTSIGLQTSKLAGYENVRMVVKNTAVPEGVELTGYTEGSLTLFDFDKVYPHLLVDDLECVIYATKDGVAYHSNPYVRSVRDYCYDTLATYANDQTAYGVALKRTLVELLDYAAAVQNKKKYMTGDLANAALTATQRAYATSSADCENIDNKEYVVNPDAVATWYQAALVFDSNIQYKLTFQTTVMPEDGWYVIARANGVNHRINVIEPAAGTPAGQIASYYIINIDDLWVSQIDSNITVTLYDKNGNALTNTMLTSIASFSARRTDLNATDRAIVDAMVKYGRAAMELSKA